MGMYNAVHGFHHDAGVLLKMLDIGQDNSKWKVGRFRDAWLNVGGTEICIFTRNGGNNRKCWEAMPGFEETEVTNRANDNANSEKCDCSGCTITHHLPKHPNYLRDEDDEFDSTYAYIYFSVPECYKSLAALMAPKEPEPTLKEKTDCAVESMKSMTPEQLRERYPELGRIWDDIAKKVGKTD